MIELLAPAGDLEKMKVAIQYGADAVYMGGGVFSLRSAAANFDEEQMKYGVEYAHSKGKKVYITANIIPKNDDIDDLYKYIRLIYSCGADAVILSDLGAFSVSKEAAPNLPIHISTQANNLNYKSCDMWHKMGASRVILARELSFEEIKTIREKCGEDLELEVFVHGAMCVSYSGRCLLSDYMASRSGNRGDCAQPCRWNYSLVEEKRPGQYMPVFENERGTFIFNSKDLCLLPYIPSLAQAGVTSFKIEGRVKSEYYVASVVKAYRTELDRYLDNPDKYVFDPRQLDEVRKVSHRSYSTGFNFGKKGEQVYESSSYIREYMLVGVVLDYDKESGRVTVEQRNKICEGDEVEALCWDTPENIAFKAENLINEKGEKISSTPHSKMVYTMKSPVPLSKGSFIRKATGE